MATSKKTPKPAAAKKAPAKKAPAKKTGAKKTQSSKDNKTKIVIAAADEFIDREELSRLVDKTQSIITETQDSAEEIISEVKSFLTNTVAGVEKKISLWRRILRIKAK